MSFSQKINACSVIVIIVVAIFGVRYYKNSHRKPVPIPPRPEVQLTIIPGWNLRQIAEYFVAQGFASSTADVYTYTGEPARDYRMVAAAFPKLVDNLKILDKKPVHVSYEGYMAPETYRVFKDASLLDVLKKFITHRDEEITDQMWEDIEQSGRSFY